MRKVTALLAALALLLCSDLASAQEMEFNLALPTSADFKAPFTVGEQSGARGVSGPFDLDNDGKMEVLVSEYTGGGRVHVVEAQGPDEWALVYSTPWADSTSSANNARYATGGDLDGDGNGEIIFIAGNSYSATNPNQDLVFGVHIYEFTGTDNDYGTLPASINILDDLTIGAADGGNSESITVADIDNDDTQELILALNGSATYDQFYVYSVNGTFEPNGLGTGFETWVQEFRVGPRENDRLYGSGSPTLMYPADLDGDGTLELSLHSWNSFNFFNADVTGVDTYALPDAANPNRFLQAAPYDNPSLVQAVVVDINQDGDDEVFYPIFDFATPADEHNLNVALLNYEDGEDIFSVTTDNLLYNFLGPLSELGLTSGDLDGDGYMELIGTGPFGYTASEYNDGESSSFIHVAEFNAEPGSDPEDLSNYAITALDTGSPLDTLGFNVVYRDSLGTMTKFYETAGGGIFPVKIQNLGDADDDGNTELAMVFQGVDDSLSVFEEVWDPEFVTGVYNTPVNAAEAGPIDSGDAYEFTFEAEPGDNLSFASMFGPSNDLFFAPAPGGIALYDAEGNPREGNITDEIMLWDAGTEENQEPGMGSNQAANQPAPNTGPDDPDNTVRLVDDGFTYPEVSEVLEVTLTPGVDGAFTVRIENVSTETTLNGNSSVPVAPGVWVIHEEAGAIFTEGGTASAGLEALAEDADPSTMTEELQEQFGFIRTVRERVAVEDRIFMRIYEFGPAFSVATEDRGGVPDGFALHQNYPNPFNPSTNIRFTLPTDARVSVRVYDVTGRLVNTLVNNQTYFSGTHQVTWDGTNASGSRVASGTYFYTLEHDGRRMSRVMLLIK